MLDSRQRQQRLKESDSKRNKKKLRERLRKRGLQRRRERQRKKDLDCRRKRRRLDKLKKLKSNSKSKLNHTYPTLPPLLLTTTLPKVKMTKSKRMAAMMLMETMMVMIWHRALIARACKSKTPRERRRTRRSE